MNLTTYTGSLDREKMSDEEKKANDCWRNQRSRCSYRKDINYKNYGAKGIRVRYGKREFIAWWLAKYRANDWRCASVGRIDHSKDYTFENIEMIERADNVREMISRTGGNMKTTPVVLIFDDKTVAFRSTKLAADFLGVDPSAIRYHISGKSRPLRRPKKINCKIVSLKRFMEAS